MARGGIESPTGAGGREAGITKLKQKRSVRWQSKICEAAGEGRAEVWKVLIKLGTDDFWKVLQHPEINLK